MANYCQNIKNINFKITFFQGFWAKIIYMVGRLWMGSVQVLLSDKHTIGICDDEICSYKNYTWFWIPLVCPFAGAILGSWLYKIAIEHQYPIEFGR